MEPVFFEVHAFPYSYFFFFLKKNFCSLAKAKKKGVLARVLKKGLGK